MPHVFVYGTLELPEVMEAVTGKRFEREPALLAGFRRGLLRGLPYPGIVEDAEAATPGWLVLHVDEAALALLDAFEDECYERREVEVELEDGLRTKAFTFAIPAAAADLVTPEPWEPAGFHERHLERFLVRCRAVRAGRPWNSPEASAP